MVLLDTLASVRRVLLATIAKQVRIWSLSRAGCRSVSDEVAVIQVHWNGILRSVSFSACSRRIFLAMNKRTHNPKDNRKCK